MVTLRLEPEEYKKHIEYEKKFYSHNIYGEDLTEKSNEALTYFLDKLQEKIQKTIGFTVWDYTISTINEIAKKNRRQVKILSLGSGPGGTEMNLAKKILGDYVIECVDINEKSLELGKQRAEIEGLNMEFIQQDINELSLQSEKYDVVFAHALLHHMMNHEHISKEIRNAMKMSGQFIVFEVIPRNGLRMWDDTKIIVDKLWSLLPYKYKYNSMGENVEEYLESLPDRDLSVDGFECIRSQDLYPILKSNFRTKIEVFGYSFARRFAEDPFGRNYEIKNNPFDKAIMDAIIDLDEYYMKTKNLKPENIFMVLEK